MESERILFMKRWCSALLIIIMITTLFTGCSNEKNKVLQDDITDKKEITFPQITDLPETTDLPQITDSSQITDSPQTTDSLQQNTSISYPFTVTDQIGRKVTIEKPVERIISSYYISTAITIALGKAENLVGIEMKADTRGLYQKAAPDLINLPAVGSGKGLNIEETANLTPDIVIIPQKLKDSVEQLEQLSIPVLVVDPETLENYNDCVKLLGVVYDCQEKANKLIEYYTVKMEEMKALMKSPDLKRPTVYLSSGSSYLSTCTSKMYQNELITLAGGINVSSELENGYWAEISKEQLLTWNPDYMFPVSYANYSIEDIKQDTDLAQVNAVKNNQIIVFPSAIEPWDYPTPSSILGVLWLAHILHPEIYTEEAYLSEAATFYKTFFGIDVTKEELGL